LLLTGPFLLPAESAAEAGYGLLLTGPLLVLLRRRLADKCGCMARRLKRTAGKCIMNNAAANNLTRGAEEAAAGERDVRQSRALAPGRPSPTESHG